MGAAGDRAGRDRGAEVALRHPPGAARAAPGRPPGGAAGPEDDEEDLVFANERGAPLSPTNLRNRVLLPAVGRAGVPRVGFHAFRHTRASMLVAAGASPLRMQRWMDHHSAAYTLDVYGHLLEERLGPGLDLEAELASEALR